MLFELARVLKDTSRTAQAGGSYQQALEGMQRLATDFPNTPDYGAHVAMIESDLAALLDGQNRREEAEKRYRRAVSLADKVVAEAPSVHPYWLNSFRLSQERLMHLLNLAGRTQEAELVRRQSVARFEKLVAKLPKEPEYGTQLVHSHFRLGLLVLADNPAEAEKVLRQAMALKAKLAAGSPEKPELWPDLYLGDVLWTAQRRPGAEHTIRQLLDIYERLAGEFPTVRVCRGELGRCYNHLGLTLAASGRLAEAEQAHRQAVNLYEQLGPAGHWYRRELVWSYNNLGGVLHKRQAPEDAEKAYRQAIVVCEKLAGDFPDIDYSGWIVGSYCDLARVLTDIGEVAEVEKAHGQALEFCTRLIEAKPDRDAGWGCRGQVYAELGQWDKAVADFAKAMELTNQVQVRYRHALAQLGAGDVAGYRSACSRLLDQYGELTNPNDGYWIAWTCALAPGAVTDFARLLQFAEKAVASDPTNYAYLKVLGATLYRAGRFEESVEQLNRAGLAYDANPGGSCLTYNWLFLAMAHHRLSHTEEAQEWLAKAARRMDQPTQEERLEPGAAEWNRKLTLQLLRREAEELLKE